MLLAPLWGMAMDDLRALIDRLRDGCIYDLGDGMVREFATASLMEEAADALDRLAAVERDAERYRHIRPMFRAFSVHIDGNHSWVATGELGRMRGPSLDAAIDAAIAARKGEG